MKIDNDADAATVLHALGRLWASCPVDSIAAEAGDLYSRLAGHDVGDYYGNQAAPLNPLNSSWGKKQRPHWFVPASAVHIPKALALAAIILAGTFVAGTAQAGMTCYWIGRYYYCNDTDGNTTTCYRVGNYTYCN